MAATAPNLHPANAPLRIRSLGVYVWLRYSAAFCFLVYGFAKLWGAQFTILDSELDKPMGQVSGFWLTWYYFGYSRAFGAMIALLQIGGAMLLTFRRTALLGACVLLPVVANIVLIDVFFQIDLGATLVALYLLIAVSGILLAHRRELFDLFWHPEAGAATGKRRTAAAMWAVRTALVLIPCFGTYWIANYNNIAPTPLDGAWQVVEATPANGAALPVMIFFERNRAYWCSFKLANGTYETHNFEVDPAKQFVTISEHWLTKGPEIFAGHFSVAGNSMVLTGKFGTSGEISTLDLVRTNVRAR